MANDLHILVIIISVFVIIGAGLPFITESLTGESTNIGLDSLITDIGDSTSETKINLFDVMGSILSMFFWTFGDIPVWLNYLFMIPRITLVVIMVRLVRGVG